MIHTTDTTARALYDAMMAAALENVADEAFHDFKHGRMRLAVLHKNLRATAAKVLKNWAAFGGGPRPATEKPRTVTWPAGALAVFRAAMQDGDLAGAVRIGREKLCLRAYEFKDGPMLALCPVPVPEIGEGFALLLLETGFYSVTDLRTGLKIGRSYKTSARTLESARSEKAHATPESWANAMQKLAATPTAPDVLPEWAALHGVTLDVEPTEVPSAYTIAAKATAPDARSVAAVVAQVRHIDISGAATAAPRAAPAPEIKPVTPVSAPAAPTPPAAPTKRPERCKTARPAPADAMARRASARKRQIQRALAGQLAPHLVANLERNGLIRNGIATRRARFLYLDDATI